MHDFLWAFLGGALLGISVVGYLYINGKIAGISGMIGRYTSRRAFAETRILVFARDCRDPYLFTGLFIQPEIVLNASIWQLIIAGLLVGFGTRLGSGCTSGHGICGISRLSKRSLIATGIFMLTGAITVFVVRHVVGAGA